MGRLASRVSGRQRRLLPSNIPSFGKLASLTLALSVLGLPVRADVVTYDDPFDNNDLATNPNGIGTGFTSYSGFNEANTYVRELNGLLQLSSSINGARRESAVSKDAIAISAAGTRFEFRGVSFANQTANTGAPNTDRLFLGVANTGPIADDFFESGAQNMPDGFWISIMTDHVVAGTGNGAWTGTSTLFYKASDGTRTALASWQFNTLFWDNVNPPPNNFTPTLDMALTLGATDWALTITGDTQLGGSPISFSGTYAGSGINNQLINGLNPAHFAVFNQTEGPGIIMSVDRMVATHTGTLVVTTPRFITPAYGFNTNGVRAGEAISLISTVIAAGTPTLQWQMENLAVPGTFTNIPGATATNLSVSTSTLGDSLARGLRLIANDGGNSVTSAVVALTVYPAVPVFLIQDTTPAGPETRNVGLSYSLTAAFDGNLPIAYFWQKSADGSTGWVNIPNATNKTYQIASLTLADTGFYRVFATNSGGTFTSTASQLTVVAGAIKYLWTVPTSIVGLNANQILTNFPNTKIAGAMYCQAGSANPITVTLSSGSPIAFARADQWAGLAGGNGFVNGTFPGTNLYTTTGNANFDSCLTRAYTDGSPRTITMSNLVVGQQYSVQLFALEGRGGTLNPPANTRTANYQDPADPTDVSSTFLMSDFAYVVGTFTASSTTETIQQNLLNNAAGNFNVLVLRAVGWNPPPYITRQPVGAANYLGNSVTLVGAAAGDTNVPSPTIVYQWKAGPSGGPYTNLVSGTKFVGATNASLTINSLTAADAAAVYVLTATNGGGSTISRPVTVTAVTPPTPLLLGHWLSGPNNFADVSGFTAPGTHDGFESGPAANSGAAYFTNDVPAGATGANSLFLGGNVDLAIANTSLLLDPGYTNTFDDKISTRFSVLFWARGYPPGTWAPAFLAKRGEGAEGWQIRRINTGNPGFTLRGTAGADDPAGSVAVDTTSWHHYAATWDSVTGVRRFYVDGRLSTELTGDTGTMGSAAAFYLTLGARESGTAGTQEAFFTGALYDVRIYNYAVTQTEIGTIGRVPPVPVTWQRTSTQLILTWPYGTLVEATNIVGAPWTTVTTTSPYTNNLTGAMRYFRVRNP